MYCTLCPYSWAIDREYHIRAYALDSASGYSL